jgi:hypothetical protein
MLLPVAIFNERRHIDDARAPGAAVGAATTRSELRVACLGAGGRQPGVGALERLGAGADLDQAQLLGRQRGLLVGVVLRAAERAPEQHGELARAGDDGDLVAAAGADALVERVQRAGLPDDRPGGLDERPARLGRALL